MLLQIYLEGGAIIETEAHGYTNVFAEDGTMKDLVIQLYEDSRAKLTYINPTKIIALVKVDPAERHPEVVPSVGS